MADFIKRRSDKPRELGAISAPKKGQPSKEGNPITALRQIAKDFRAGVSALQRAQQQPGVISSSQTVDRKSTTTNTERVIERTTDRTSVVRPASGDRPATPVSTSETPSGDRPASVPQPIRTPSRHTTQYVPSGAARSTSKRIPARQLVTGADREARRHFDGTNKEGSAANLPSAARLAQIVRANELMKAGELPANHSVATWAKAIESGKRRQVADIDPEYVRRILHEAVGGAAAADRLLLTPEIARMIERHHSTLVTMQGNVQASAKTAELTRSYRSGKARRAPTKTSPQQLQHVATTRDYHGMPAPEVAAGTRSTSEALETMLATNEEPHLAEQAQQAGQAQQDETEIGLSPNAYPAGAPARPRKPVMSGHMVDPPAPGDDKGPSITNVNMPHSTRSAVSTGHGAPPKPETPAIAGSPAPTRHSVAPSLRAAPEAKRDLASSMAAPPMRANSQPAGDKEEKPKKRERMELSGTLTIINKGQTIGEARMNGALG